MSARQSNQPVNDSSAFEDAGWRCWAAAKSENSSSASSSSWRRFQNWSTETSLASLRGQVWRVWASTANQPSRSRPIARQIRQLKKSNWDQQIFLEEFLSAMNSRVRSARVLMKRSEPESARGNDRRNLPVREVMSVFVPSVGSGLERFRSSWISQLLSEKVNTKL